MPLKCVGVGVLVLSMCVYVVCVPCGGEGVCLCYGVAFASLSPPDHYPYHYPSQ